MTSTTYSNALDNLDTFCEKVIDGRCEMGCEDIVPSLNPEGKRTAHPNEGER